MVVVSELRASGTIRNWAISPARRCELDELRIAHGRLDSPVPIGEDGGSLRVELNHTDPYALPSGFRLGDNDTRILAVAKNLAGEGYRVTVVSKDPLMRVKARPSAWTPRSIAPRWRSSRGGIGFAELEVSAEDPTPS